MASTIANYAGKVSMTKRAPADFIPAPPRKQTNKEMMARFKMASQRPIHDLKPSRVGIVAKRKPDHKRT